MMNFIFLYGPPGSGKTSTGRPLAERLGLPFYDLDHTIEASSGMSIAEIFDAEGETGFREREHQTLKELLSDEPGVVALGGGTLTVPETRRLAESAGQVLCFTCQIDVLERRLANTRKSRPLLAGNLRSRLEGLLSRRASHYDSFPLVLDTSQLTALEAVALAQTRLGHFRVQGMNQPYHVLVEAGGLDQLGLRLRALGLKSPLALVSDENVSKLYAAKVIAALRNSDYAVQLISIPAGEPFKTIETVNILWQGFLTAGLERSSTVIALGGGVTGDLAGFAAATFLRGVRWVNLPTSLLAMADASLGGKTGADLAQGKNLVGSFHPPALVLADPQVLQTLPGEELRSGLAEVLKHGVISDPALFEMVAGTEHVPDTHRLDEIVRRAMAVKIQVIEEDPYEKGRRAALNYGHTVGHAVELVSGYHLRHGEAIAIGMVIEAQLAERIGLSQAGLARQISETLAGLGLPIAIPTEMSRQDILAAMRTDKKRQDGKLRLALPRRIGEVITGVEVAAQQVLEVL